MKTKNQLSMVIVLASLLVTGIVNGEDPVKEAKSDATTSGSGKNLGWQESTKRTYVLVSTGLNLSAGGSVNQIGYSFNVTVSSNLSLIECCNPTSVKESWCNFNADDERCKN